MNEFLQTALTFPTLVYSVLLAVCAAYWLLAATGLADGDGPFGGDGDAGDAAGMLAKLGLGGVPAMVVATVFSFAAWIGTYFAQLLVLRELPEGVRALAGAATMLAIVIPAAAATALVLRPLAKTMARLRPDVPLLGRAGVLITPTLTSDYGQASVDDGGAGLVLQVRGEDQLQRGDRIVLIEYLEGQNAYRVVSEQKFLSR